MSKLSVESVPFGIKTQTVNLCRYLMVSIDYDSVEIRKDARALVNSNSCRIP